MKIIEQKLLKDVCTLGIGGPAESYVEVFTVKEMQEVLKECQENQTPYFILGKGSNTLFNEKGFAGLVIHNKIDFIEEKENGLYFVGGGYSFSLLGSKTARKGWSGLEFASGIPGTVGGAVFMNAGANGTETCDPLVSVDFVAEDGTLQHFLRKDLTFSYRHSPFQKMKGAIVSATFQLTPSEQARETQLGIINYRTKTQPYGEKSAGCMFRNPPTGSAGALIDACGLKGIKVGGAKVSDLHANFIVNDGESSSEDIIKLIAIIQEKVKETHDIQLESEVQIVPYRPLS